MHKRLRAIIADERRRFHVFSNDFHRATYCVRSAGESPNDRNDRAIRTAAQWYQAQLGGAVEILLLTNDGELANRLTHPRFGVHKGYEVTVGGRLSEEDVERLKGGIFLSDRSRSSASRTSRSKLTIIKRDRDRTRLYMELREGRNRQIRRMLANLGFPVKKLRRVRMGPLALKGLSPGGWRELSASELTSVRRAAYRVRDRLKGSA